MPVNLSTSTFWFTPTCFSPTTCRCPLGNTSTTVAVMAPWNEFSLSVAPSPSMPLAVDALALSLVPSASPMKGNNPTAALSAEVRLTLELDSCDALTLSWMLMVNTSPTRRARWSSKPGRYDDVANSEPVGVSNART